ncbi:WD repeat-containing protein 47 [Hydra vulgaris]|uniref:WD repeat-containing protein 47 n=1 Tax=Hydra vulgaris TaxID=6087 RepID=A0ABM4BFW9_HYDVU
MENITQLTILEEDILKIILEFLSSRHYHVSMRTLEKESCVINSDFSDEVLFLRELVLDGDYNEVMEFGNSFSTNKAFNQGRFNYIILRQKFVELIYMKSHVIDKQNNDMVEEVMKTLGDLQPYCTSKEEYSNLCWLLTVPDLSTEEEFKHWSLDISRIKCFDDLLECLSAFMPLVKKKVNVKNVASKDRLIQLVVKGLFYESCIDFCQSVATGNLSDLQYGPSIKNNVLKSICDEYPSTLLSWIRCLPYEIFQTPFEQDEIDVCLAKLPKKNLITHSVDFPKSSKTIDNEKLSQSFDSKNVKSELLHLNKKATEFSRDALNNNNNKLNDSSNSSNSKSTVYCPDQVQNQNYKLLQNSDVEEFKASHKKKSHIESPSYESNSKNISPDLMSSSQDNKHTVVVTSLKKHEDILATSLNPLESDNTVRLDFFESKTPKQLEDEQQRRAEILKKLQAFEERRIQVQKVLSNEEGLMAQNDNQHQDEIFSNTYTKPKMKLDPSLLEQPFSSEGLYNTSYAASTPNPKSVKYPKVPNLNEASVSQSKNNHQFLGEPPINKSNVQHLASKGGYSVNLPDGSGHLNTSTPKSKRKSDADTPPPLLISPVKERSKSDSFEGRLIFEQDEGKENNPGGDGVVLGPVINGVRRPISSNHISSLSYSDAQSLPDETSMKERIPQQAAALKLKGAGPKIKTKDGNAVHLIELIKPNKEDLKRQLNATDIYEKRDSRQQQQDDTNKYHDRYQIDSQRDYNGRNLDDEIKKYSAVSLLEDSQAVRSVAFHPDGAFYAVGANSKILRICKMINSNDSVSKSTCPPAPVLIKRQKYHRGSIYCMAWSPDGKLLATGSNDKSIKLFQFDGYNCTQSGDDVELNIHNGTVRELAFVPNRAGLLISGGAGDGNINITDVLTQQVTGILSGHSGNVMTVYAGDGDVIASGGSDNTLRLWDLRSQRCIDVVVVGDSVPASVALNGSDHYMASGQEDGSILLYDLSAGRTLQNFRLHQTDCRSIRFSINSKYLLTASYDSNISITHLTSSYNEMTVPRHYVVGKHSDKVIQCRWHPKDDVFLSSSADRTAILWKST